MMTAVVQALTSLSPGQRATVAELNLAAPNRSRLMELGLVPGTVLELVRFAPLGDPVEVNLRGYNLTLRRHEAEHIVVRAGA